MVRRAAVIGFHCTLHWMADHFIDEETESWQGKVTCPWQLGMLSCTRLQMVTPGVQTMCCHSCWLMDVLLTPKSLGLYPPGATCSQGCPLDLVMTKWSSFKWHSETGAFCPWPHPLCLQHTFSNLTLHVAWLLKHPRTDGNGPSSSTFRMKAARTQVLHNCASLSLSRSTNSSSCIFSLYSVCC
jgi:hypothetical protein